MGAAQAGQGGCQLSSAGQGLGSKQSPGSSHCRATCGALGVGRCPWHHRVRLWGAAGQSQFPCQGLRGGDSRAVSQLSCTLRRAQAGHERSCVWTAAQGLPRCRLCQALLGAEPWAGARLALGAAPEPSRRGQSRALGQGWQRSDGQRVREPPAWLCQAALGLWSGHTLPLPRGGHWLGGAGRLGAAVQLPRGQGWGRDARLELRTQRSLLWQPARPRGQDMALGWQRAQQLL